MKMILIILLLTTISQVSFGQGKLENRRVENYKNFCEYLKRADSTAFDRSVILNQYVDFYLGEKDTSQSRFKNSTSHLFNFCSVLKKGMGSLNKADYDVIPISEYHFNQFKPYDELAELNDRVFVCYLKKNPDQPLGFLLFAPQSDKLYSWMLINQGGYHYFLTLNLIVN
jgi:hypothetical protein